MKMKIKNRILLLLCLALVFTACGAFAEAPAAPFSIMSETQTGMERNYYSSDYYLVLVRKDGAWWRVYAQIDDRYAELYNALTSDSINQNAYEAFDSHVQSLPVASAEQLSEEPLDEAALKAYAGENLKGLLADGFTFICIRAYTTDESGTGDNPECLTLTDDSGKSCRVPLYVIDTGYQGGIFLQLDKGIYSYEFPYSGRTDTLRKASEDGSLGELVPGEGIFNGFSTDTMNEIPNENSAHRLVTEEEALAIRTVGDAQKYICSSFLADGDQKYIVLIIGKDGLWTASAVPDERYRELDRATTGALSDEAISEANTAFWEYQASLPVTVAKVEGDYPRPVEDLSAYTGKSFRELQEEGFEFWWYSASTPMEGKEAFNVPLVLKNSDGSEYRKLYGNILCFPFNDYILFTASQGLYEYDIEFEGNADTLAAAAANGTFPDLIVTKVYLTAPSGDAPVMLGVVQQP